MVVLDDRIARSLFQALAESWPEDADVQRVAIAQGKPGHVVVTMWTALPAAIIGHRGEMAAEIRDRLRTAVPQVSVELRVEPAVPPKEAGGLRVQDLRGEEDDVGQVSLADLGLRAPHPWASHPPSARWAPDAQVPDAQVTDAQARDLVPELVGMTVSEALAKARASGFALTTADPDGAPITARSARADYERWIVVGQSPVSGVLVALHSHIVVAIEGRGRGGQSGDREPRVPRPPGGLAHLERDAIDEVE